MAGEDGAWSNGKFFSIKKNPGAVMAIKTGRANKAKQKLDKALNRQKKKDLG